MASLMITEIKSDLSKIRNLKKKTAEKLTAESLKLYKGFTEMCLEKREEILASMEEFCRIALTQVNRVDKIKR